MMESANTHLIEEKHQLETSVMQVLAENNQQKTENNQLKTENNQQKTENNQLKTENNRLKTEINQLWNQIAAERIQLESHKKENLHRESRHQREKQIFQSEVERLIKEVEHITRVSISKKSVVSILHSYKVSPYILSRALTTLGLINFNGKV